jgi:hypothetical protein
MKTGRPLLAILILFVFATLVAVEAKQCIGCSEQLPDNANFCAMCMTPQPKAVNLSQTAAPKRDYREILLDTFAFIDEFEANFHEMKYLNVLGKMPEIKTRFNNATMTYKRLESKLAEDHVILAQLYAAKFQLFEGLTGIMKNLRIDGGYKAAILKSSMVVLALYNQIIDQFREKVSFTGEKLEILKKQVANIARRTQKYTITGKYLQIGKEKIPGGEKIMVLEIVDKKALVLYMGPTMDNNPLEAMINLRDLEKRTTWKRENQLFYVQK